jgi:hypothetical protein
MKERVVFSLKKCEYFEFSNKVGVSFFNLQPKNIQYSVPYGTVRPHYGNG